MAAFLRLLDPVTGVLLYDSPLISFSLDYGVNQSVRWTASVPLNMPDVPHIFQGLTVEFYIDGVLFFEGILQDFPPSFTNLETLSLSGRSFIDQLYASRSYPLSYYTDKSVLGILFEILYLAGWGIGSIATLENPEQTTTIDLRGESNALTQLNKFLSGLKHTYWREGETRLGTRTLDLGMFQEDSGIVALLPADRTLYDGDETHLHTITDLSYKVDFTKALYGIRVTGGPVIASAGVERVINLGDAITDDPTLRVDPDFPIIEDLNEKEWTLINVRDFPYSGGQVLSTETLVGVVTWIIGDNSAGAVETWRHLLLTFIPYPGILRHITIWIGAISASFIAEYGTVFDIYWKIFEVSSSNNRTLGTLVYSGLFDHLPVANEVLRLTPDTEVLLEPGKLYGLVIGTTVAPIVDVTTMQIKVGNRASVSQVFGIRAFDNVLPTVGTTFGATVVVPIMEVITDPVAQISAGTTVEKQEKFAPPKSGAVTAAAEVQKAGAALYQYALNRLLESPPTQREYSLNAVGTRYLPKVGDTIYVQGTARVEWFDPISKLVQRITYAEIATDLRVISYGVKFDNETITVSYKLLDSEGVLKSDRLLTLYDKVAERKPPTGGVLPSPWGLLLDPIALTVGPQSPDAQFDDGRLAVTVEVSIFDGIVPSLPVNTEWVYLAGNPYGTSTSGQLRIEVIEEPIFSSSGSVRFLVGLVNRDWEYGDVANLTVTLLWR